MKFKARPIFKDVSLTFFAQGIIFLAVLFIYRLIANNFGPEGVGKYSLVRRVIGLFQPILLLGFGVGLTRYIAMSKDENQGAPYIKAGGLTIIGLTLFFLFIINLSKKFFAKTFFGNINYTDLVGPFSLLLIGLILYSLIYSYFRGRLLVKTFNLLQVISLGLIPVGILILLRDITVEKLITLIGVITFATALIFALFYIREILGSIKKWQFSNSLKQLLRYGLPRVPGGFALAGLLSLGPIFAAHLVSIQEVGFLSISQSLLITTGAAVAPLGLILLPKVSNLLANGKQETIKEGLDFLIPAIIQCSIFISVQLIIFSDSIIKYWLGPNFINAIPIMRIVFCAMTFYLFFATLRSVLNAVKVKPINAINAFISLGAFLFSAGALLFLVDSLSPIIGLGIAFVTGIGCLGVLTHISIRKIFGGSLKKDLNYLFVAIIVNILLIIPALLLKPIIASRLYYLVAFEILIGIIYLLILWLLKIEWIREIPKIILIKTKDEN